MARDAPSSLREDEEHRAFIHRGLQAFLSMMFLTVFMCIYY